MTTFTANSTHSIATSLMLAGNPFVGPCDRNRLHAHLLRAGLQSFSESMRRVSLMIRHAGWVKGSRERLSGKVAIQRSRRCSWSLSKHSNEPATR